MEKKHSKINILVQFKGKNRLNLKQTIPTSRLVLFEIQLFELLFLK